MDALLGGAQRPWAMAVGRNKPSRVGVWDDMSQANASGPQMDLALPFAVLGLGGALVAGDFFRVGCFRSDDRLAVLLIAAPPFAAAVLGHLLSQRTNRGPLAGLWVACILGTCGVAAGVGAFVGLACWSVQGVGMGAANGLACGAVFSLGFAVVLAWNRRTGRARPGSLVEASDRRTVLAAIAAVLAIATTAAELRASVYPVCTVGPPTTSPIVAVLAVATLTLLVLWQAARAWLASRDVARVWQTFDGAIPAGLRCVDYGVGDELRGEIVGAQRPYRDGGSAVRLLRGDAAQGRRVLVQALTQEAALLGVALVALALTH
jgi:hypothetical protein